MSSSVTLSIAKEMVTAYIEAEKAVLKNQAYTIRDRTYRRADLEEIRAGRKDWEKTVASLERGGMRVRRILPRMN